MSSEEEQTEEQRQKEAAAAAKKAARQEAKDLMKEALAEFTKENAPKQRTTQPERPSLFSTLFGSH